VARYWQATADLDEAARDAYRALRLVRSCRPGVAPVRLVAEIALTLAHVERDRDRYAASRAHLEYSLSLLEPATSTVERDGLLVWTLVGLGDWHRRAGGYRQASEALDRALHLAGTRAAAEPGPLTAVLTSLGILAKELGEHAEAAQWYARVHKIHRDSGATPADAATLQHNLAGLEYSRGRYPQAESHARVAVALRRQADRVAHVDIAADVAVLASAVARQGRHDAARALFDQALTACRTARPPRRYEIAVHLHNLADIEHAAGHVADAERLYRQAMASKEELLGADHPEVGLVASNLGTLLHEQHRHDEAAECYRRALAIAERAYPPHHRTVAAIRQHIDELPPYPRSQGRGHAQRWWSAANALS
jgi:tetratricopeptide (TPR) repeat protein